MTTPEASALNTSTMKGTTVHHTPTHAWHVEASYLMPPAATSSPSAASAAVWCPTCSYVRTSSHAHLLQPRLPTYPPAGGTGAGAAAHTRIAQTQAQLTSSTWANVYMRWKQ